MKLAGGGRYDPVRILPIRARRLIAVCSKCGRKLGGGFGPDGDSTLAKTLRRTAEGATGKKAVLRIVETKCLDICPKHAVAVIDSARPGQVAVVRAGAPAETVVAELELDASASRIASLNVLMIGRAAEPV